MGQDDVKCHGGIEAESWVGWIHEALLLVRLNAEDKEPEVEW